MMKSTHLAYLWSLLRANLMVYRPEWKRLIIMSFFMIVQNSMFFALWVIFFHHVSNLKGWMLPDVARMFGITASAIGTSLFFLNGARTIAYLVNEGTIDQYITKPRHPLPSILFSSSSPASLGDILYGPLMWWVLGDVSWADVPLLLLLTVLGTILFTSMAVVIYSISFWLKGNTRFPDQLFELLIIFSCSVQHGQSPLLKTLMFTLIPAGFIAYLPTQLIHEFSWAVLALVAGAVVFYAGLAVIVFNKGLRRYVASRA